MANDFVVNSIPDDWETGIVGEDSIVKGRIGWMGYKKSDLRDFGPVVIGGTNIKSSLYLDMSETRHISREKYEEAPNIQLKKGDVLLVQRGNGLGDTAYFDGSIEEATINPTLIILSEFKGDSRFLFYYLTSPQGRESILSLASGSSIPALYQNHIKQIVYPKPSIPEQRAIAGILGTLDDKIELNRRMNRTLESMARAVFRQWFVENEVVENWKFGKLGDLVTLIKERVEPTPEKDNDRYIALDDMPPKSIDLSQYRLGSDVNSSITRFKKGDILFGSMRPYFHKVGVAPFDGVTRTTTFTLRPKQDVFRAFALYWFFSDEVIEFSTTASVGTTIPYVRWETLEKYELPIPPHEMMAKFTKYFHPLWLKIISNGKESRTLASLRDTLLPKLMRGEVRVKV